MHFAPFFFAFRMYVITNIKITATMLIIAKSVKFIESAPFIQRKPFGFYLSRPLLSFCYF